VEIKLKRASKNHPVNPATIAPYIKRVEESNEFASRSSNLPTWCPGCGYFGITHALTATIFELGLNPDMVAFVSGIGCAGRYPYFISTYGFHTVHGRALPVATGLKIANPLLNVFVVGGDGDGVGIGGGHLPHGARRNVDLVYILFDNSIYGLTKGQTSPTSPLGFVSKTTPYGNNDASIDPLVLSISHGATFAARGFAGDVEGLKDTFKAAIKHRGFSFIHLLTTCVTFDKKNSTWDNLWEKCTPLPKEHDKSKKTLALTHALEHPYDTGIYYKEARPTMEENLRTICAQAAKSNTNTNTNT
jgi:2-oxoglutarate ferredoxin oxidoreductase subunit beta